MGALWDMLTCRQIHGFLERVRTRLSKCNHPGQKTFLVSLRLFFKLCVFDYAAWTRELSVSVLKNSTGCAR